MADEKPPETPDLGKLVEAAVAKHGDNTSALKALVSDNYALRDDLKAARAKLPSDGALVLTGDDAKEWGAYRSLGKPSDLGKIASEHKAYADENAALKWEGVLRGVAEKTGTKYEVLRKLVAPGVEFPEKPVKDAKTGKESPVLHVKDGDAVKPFDEYMAEKHPDFLPALRPGEKANQDQPRQPLTPSRTDVRSHEPPAAEPASIASRLKFLGVASY